MIKKTQNEKETRLIAEAFAKNLYGGEIILLSGDIGSGKSVFVRAMARRFGINETITSPTFSLMNVYRVLNQPFKTFVHIDCYRLTCKEELENIGALEFFFQKDTIVAIEWPEIIEEKILQNKSEEKIFKIIFSHGKILSERVIQIHTL